MFHSQPSRVIETGPVPACIAQPARFHAQVRAARSPIESPLRFESPDSALTSRLHIV